MSFNFNFRLAESKRDIDKLTQFVLMYPLNYRGYFDWVDKAREELLIGYKESVLCFSEDILVGNLIFQPSKSMKGFCELKNGRTLKEFQRRYILSFMIRQVEVEARERGDVAVIGDARSDRLDVLTLFLSKGYKEVARADLYGEGYEDVVLIKPFIPREENSWLYAA
ncbi:MAG: hypothetical protein ABIJ14_03390 [Nanoarchaeota archaeon]|nr:hypothetical protein [Nanoarchaeota archaeon]